MIAESQVFAVTSCHAGERMTNGDDDVLRSAGYLLIKAGHYIGLEFDAALTELGLSGREFLLLSFVRSSSGLSQQELSARLGLDPTIVVGLVDALEDRGLVPAGQGSCRPPPQRAVGDAAGRGDPRRGHRRGQTGRGGVPRPAAGEPSGRQLAKALRAVLAPRLAWLAD